MSMGAVRDRRMVPLPRAEEMQRRRAANLSRLAGHGQRQEFLEAVSEVADRLRGPALMLGLTRLTVTERRIFDWLYFNMPYAAPHDGTLAAVFDRVTAFDPSLRRSSLHTLRTQIARMREKLVGTGWSVEACDGAYRLVDGTLPRVV